MNQQQPKQQKQLSTQPLTEIELRVEALRVAASLRRGRLDLNAHMFIREAQAIAEYIKTGNN